MISRRKFAGWPVAAAAGVAASKIARAGEENDLGWLKTAPGSANSSRTPANDPVIGSWNALMTFDAPPPPPTPRVFWVLETYFPEGLHTSMAALPDTTAGHGNWNTSGSLIKIRSRFIVLPAVVGVQIRVEVTEEVELDSSGDHYTGKFSVLFQPDGGTPFTLTGVPLGARIPPA